MEYYRTSVAVRAPVDTLFNFFADPQNLSKVSPKGIGLRVDPVDLPLKLGSRVRIRFRYGLVPIRWELSIKSLKKGDRFIDWQEKGPFREWRHTHLFSRTGNMTTVVDMVEYELPYGFFGPMLNALLIRPAIASYFRYRQARLVEIFGGEGAVAARGEGRAEGRREGRGERGDREGRGGGGERGEGRRRDGKRGERAERGERGEREGRRERGERQGTEAQGERRERGGRGGRGRGAGRERDREREPRDRDRQPGDREREPRDRERQPGDREREPRDRDTRDRGRERPGRDREPVRGSNAGLAARPSAPRRGSGEEGEWVDEGLARAAEKILQREKRERLRDREGAEIDDGETVRVRRAIDEFSADEERGKSADADTSADADADASADEGSRRRRRRGGRGRRGRGRDERDRRDTAAEPAAYAGAIDDAPRNREPYDSFSEDVEAQPGIFTEDRADVDQEIRASELGAIDEGEAEGSGRRGDRGEDRGDERRERGGRRGGGRDRGERGGERGGSRSRGPRGGHDSYGGSEGPERERIGIVPIYYPGASFDPDDVTSDAASSDATHVTESLSGHGALILPGPRRRRTWGRGPQRIALHPPELAKGDAGDAPHAPPSPDTMPSTTDNR